MRAVGAYGSRCAYGAVDQLAEQKSAAEDAESRAVRVETRATELERQLDKQRWRGRRRKLRNFVRRYVIPKTKKELSDWEQRWEDE